MAFTDELNLNGNAAYIKGADVYDGADLTVKFAGEIANATDAWNWIQSRIASGNYGKLHVGDYIPVTCTNGNTFRARIAGINTYTGAGDSAIGNHIDFISQTLWPTAFKMNLIDMNNGTSTTYPYPWITSNAYYFLNSLSGSVRGGTNANPSSVAVNYTQDGVYVFLPSALKSVIVDKYIALPKRYSTSGKIISDNGWAWVNAGKLWLPSEVELTGSPVWGSSKYGAAGFTQYPLFANKVNRTSNQYAYWTLSAVDGNDSHFVSVNAGSAGNTSYAPASSQLYGFICFRVAASNASGSGQSMDGTAMPSSEPTVASVSETLSHLGITGGS